MKSRTKNHLSPEQIKRLVEINFGPDCKIGTIEELKGGMFNSAYLIERLKEKDRIVLKVSPEQGTKTLTYEKDLMPAEVEVYRLITENTTIPIPRILAYDFSRQYIPGKYFFMTALKGTPMNKVKNLTKENREAIKLELADCFAQLHGIKGPYFGYFTEDPKTQYGTWKEAFLQMLTVLLEDGKVHGIKLPYEKYEKLMKKKVSCLEAIVEPSLVDYDLWAGNVFLKQAGNAYVIEGIVDFERAFWGDPLADFPPALMILKNLREETAFWEEYQKKSGYRSGLAKEEELRLAWYSLYIYTIMTVETFRYGFLYSKLQKIYAVANVKKFLRILEQEQ